MPRGRSKSAAVASCRLAPAERPCAGTTWRAASTTARPVRTAAATSSRYDSPEFGGFVASASWGEDDLWDTSLSYKGEIHDFKLVAKIGYGESADPVATNCGGPTGNFKCTWWGAAATAMHQPTGLYLYGGYGQQTIELAAGRLR